MPNPKRIAEGRHLRLLDADRWEYVSRRRGTGVVGIVALTTEDDVVLVEQHRVPVDRPVLELPAGLVGDDDADESRETRLEAARRELREETGFTSPQWTELGTVTSSAGLTDEQVTLFVARNATRTHPGGGVEGETIEVHLVPRTALPDLLERRLRDGAPVDGKVLAIESLLALAEAIDRSAGRPTD